MGILYKIWIYICTIWFQYAFNLLSGATKLLNLQPQSVSCPPSPFLSLSPTLYVCVAIIHSNGFSNTIYAE